MIKIALSGKQGSGKTTVAGKLTHIFNERGLTVMQLSTSDVIHRMAKRWFDRDDRDFLQKLGVAVREIAGPGWFTAQLFAEPPQQGIDVVIFESVRYEQELQLVEQCGFAVIRLHTTEALQHERDRTIGLDHETENALDDIKDGRYSMAIEPHKTIDEIVEEIMAHYPPQEPPDEKDDTK